MILDTLAFIIQMTDTDAGVQMCAAAGTALLASWLFLGLFRPRGLAFVGLTALVVHLARALTLLFLPAAILAGLRHVGR